MKRKGELQEQNKRLSQDIEAKKARLDEYGNIITLSVFETCKRFHFYHHATLKFERKIKLCYVQHSVPLVFYLRVIAKNVEI